MRYTSMDFHTSPLIPDIGKLFDTGKCCGISRTQLTQKRQDRICVSVHGNERDKRLCQCRVKRRFSAERENAVRVLFADTL